ncbi:hypothetical protein A9485_28430 [Bacillus cereus]|uniref:hypothetical protein n=1 Tax=Bacillus cereus group TaxID=86661 RepID=UPI0007C4A306|nr:MULTISPECIES: hypothetical protein [Bacillus cereus group]MCU5452060.1 hypothetical protein [Bacillus cereus]MEB9886415.1 hypothetical protein [Bacillus cereus]MEC2091677.1 hypothetical protein [Bacillus paranthracis]OJD96863.1 hypothetical protein A9485_28430 [Bacillus cereus]OKA32701.1 hypothetical protein BJR06_26295 [Bacillus cereus]
MVKFSLLNIEMTLKGIANKEEKNVTDIETFKIDTIFSFEVIANIYKDIGRIVIEVNAVKNEILVNTLKFSLFKKSPPFTKNNDSSFGTLLQWTLRENLNLRTYRKKALKGVKKSLGIELKMEGLIWLKLLSSILMVQF